MTEASAGDGRFTLTIDREGLSCAVVIHPGSSESLPTGIAIRAALEDQRVDPARIEEGAIEALLERAADDPGEEQTGVVARGLPAEHGANAEFELSPEIRDRFEAIQSRKDRLGNTPDPETPTQAGDGEETVDFRDQSAFVIVQSGDVIGSASREAEGEDGIDVRGGVIAAKKGRSLPVKMNDSLSVIGGRVVAQIDGVLRYQIDKVQIDPTLDINGDVDYETGNVDFPGDVNVTGGVKDHFVVRAGGGITIHKLIEAAEIFGGDTVTLNQGMAGREMGRLDIQGDLRAGYLDGVVGEIHGCLKVAREIKECRLRVERRVDSPESTVYGGRLDARQRVDVAVIGGPGGVPTEIAIGNLRELETLADRLSTLKQSLTHEAERSGDELEALQGQIQKLTATQAERLTELQFSQINCTGLADRVVDAASRLLDAAGNWSETGLTIRRAVYKGVRIQLRNTTLVIREMIQGPILLDLDGAGSPRCFLRGSAEPSPIGEIAVIEDSGEDHDPIRRLRDVSAEAA